jgi:hypothetical protein
VRAAAALTLTLLALGCKRKFEILPADAKQVTRSDKTENAGEGEADVALREYKFTHNNQVFLCESREFISSTAALQAAKKTIAERPQEEQKTDKAHFALSGRSVWLRADKQLVWCMLSSSKGDVAAMHSVKEVFLKKFREVS